MNSVIVMAPDELEQLLERTVRRVLEERAASEPAASDWTDPKGAAELLGVHPRTVHRMVEAGTLPGTRVGKLLRIKRADVVAYLEREGG